MRNFKKVLCIILSLAMLTGIVSLVSYAEFGKNDVTSTFTFTTMSDPHYYPASLTGNNCKAYQDYCNTGTKLYSQSEAIVRTCIETIVQRNPGLKYVLIPGDLTKDSEYRAHIDFAKLLLEYEEKYGIEFIVTTGNHDINSPKATTFENGKEEKARAITADEFRQVYAELGYDLAYEEYADYYSKTYPGKSNDVRNKLSYVVDLDNNYRLIVIDSCVYSFGETFEKAHTEGEITEETMQWIKAIADDSKASGKTPMVMVHHGLAAHMETEPTITQAFPLNDYLPVAEEFASWGIHYAFTGHLHTEDIACVINDDGEALYDCETPSVTGYPCTYREMTIKTYEDGESEMSFESVDFDDKAKMTFDGITYDNNTYKYKAFDICFGGNMSEDGKADMRTFLPTMASGFLKGLLEDIQKAGSITEFLKTMNLDLEAIIGGFLQPYIGEGIAVGGYNIFSVDNIMWFIDDLLGQVYDLYIKDPENLYSLIDELVAELCTLKVSEVPCTKFIDTFGFGDKNKGGTLDLLVLDVVAYWYTGNEDSSDDKFLQDVLKNLENGSLLEVIFDKVVDLLLHDVVEDALLSKLEIRLDKLLNDDVIGKKLGEGINYLVDKVLRGDTTYMNLVNTIFELEILPYKDLYDILDQLLLSRYLTPSQFEGTGTFAAYVITDFSSDENPKFMGDNNVTYSTRKVEVPVSRENYRLPTMVSVTFGEDTQTSAYINWFSKSTVDGDIEIYKADKEPSFTGIATEKADFGIKVESEKVIRSFPGIDIGVLGFLTYEFPMNRHTVTLTNLTPGETYYYRIGDAERGWWSETGKLTTADGSDNVTFFHMTDPQSQSQAQYERSWAKITEIAFDLYPDASFIMNTGDLADHGDNTKQWQWMFDTASSELMSTFMMPAAGNHEEHGSFAISNNFVIANAPEQDTLTGVYYSFDYNNIHVAVLNTNDLDENEALTAKQIKWLQEDMENSKAQWKFVALHKAPYSQGSHYKDDDVCQIREQLQNLMPALGVDMVFQGHDHVYMRTGSLVNNSLTAYDRTYLKHDGAVYRAQINPDGTTYVISGTSGVKTYITNDDSATDKYFPRGEKLFAVDAPMFSAIEIEDGVLYFTAYAVGENGAEVVDRIAIQKNTTQGEVVEGYTEPEPETPEEKSELLKTLQTILEIALKVLKVMMNICKMYFIKPVA